MSQQNKLVLCSVGHSDTYSVVAAVLMCCSECPAVEDSVSAQPVRERISTQFDFLVAISKGTFPPRMQAEIVAKHHYFSRVLHFKVLCAKGH